MSAHKPASANVELIRAKATKLKRLVYSATTECEADQINEVKNATKKLRSQLDDFFEGAFQRLKKRQTELRAALDRRLALAEAVGGGRAEQALLEEAAVEAEAGSADLLQRLNEAIALRERPCMENGGMDLAEAERRARRLLDCLRLDWGWHENDNVDDHVDWVHQRRDASKVTNAGCTAENTVPNAAVSVHQLTKEDQQSCGICNQEFIDPRRLPRCGHVFCAPCLVALLDARTRDLACPECGLSGGNNFEPLLLPSASSRMSVQTDNLDGVRKNFSGLFIAMSVVPCAAAGSDRTEIKQADYEDDIEISTIDDLENSENHGEVVLDVVGAESNYSDSDASNDAASDSSGSFEFRVYRTVGAPKSLTFVHDRFYTVEGRSIRKYRWQDGSCMGKLNPTDEDGGAIEFAPMYVDCCQENDWLLILDNDNCRIICVDLDECVRLRVGPRISAKYSLENPVQVVSSGTRLFICCPEQAIFFVRILDNRAVTQPKEQLRLIRPIRIAWSRVNSHLIVMDDEGECRYTFHTFFVAGDIGGLTKSNIFSPNIVSDVQNFIPHFACCPVSDEIICIANCTKIQFNDSFWHSANEVPRLWYEVGESKWLSDICMAADAVHRIFAVCDKKARRILRGLIQFVIAEKNCAPAGNECEDETATNGSVHSSSTDKELSDAVVPAVVSSSRTASPVDESESSEIKSESVWSDASDDASSDSSGLYGKARDCKTFGRPKSLTFVHDIFYTVENCCVRKYRWQDCRCLGKLSLVDEEGQSVYFQPFFVRRCHINDWLVIVDKEGRSVICADSCGIVRIRIGPRISKRYCLEDPVQAVSSGTHLFICCPETAIFFVRISDKSSATQTKERLGLTEPIQLDWSEHTDRLIVMDKEDDSLYTFYAFEVTGSGISCLTKIINYNVDIQSVFSPQFVCLLNVHRFMYTCDSTKLMSIDSELVDANLVVSIKLVGENPEWKLLSDLCTVGNRLVAVCDQKARMIRIILIN